MNRLKLILAVFASILTMLAYQNCQKMGFGSEDLENNESSSIEPIGPTTVGVELNYHMGYGHCMDRCLTGTKISADLQEGQITIINSITNSVPEVAAAKGVPVTPAPVGPITIQLTRSQFEKLQHTIDGLELEIRNIPSCSTTQEFCARIVDNPDFTHYFSDSDGRKHKVFTPNGIDPNLDGEIIWVMHNPNTLACNLKEIIESSSISEQDKQDSLDGLKTALNFYDSYNPLECP